MVDWVTANQCETYWANIYLAGPIEVAKQAIRKYALKEGICVTVTPTQYIYSGGEETGYVVRLSNYPRYPWTPERIGDEARAIFNLLVEETHQWSGMIQFPERTLWYTRRPA